MYTNNYGECNNNSLVLGNSVNVNLCNIDDAEVRADVVVKEINAKRIWGQVINCYGNPMANMQVKLIRIVCNGQEKYYEGVSHTLTDCEGFYQFDVCDDDKACYKILISKAVNGGETILDTQGGNCNPCNYPGCYPTQVYNPCKEGENTVIEYDPHECNCNECNHAHGHGCNCHECNHTHGHGCNCHECNHSYGYENHNCDCTTCKGKGCSCNPYDKKQQRCHTKTNYASYTRI